ncbi:VanZ family protein [Thioalkalivibrio sulfidiphilus]|uniref:VanZ family protein n=1 Tax=Thioalkalivibrio sulfidiphilus TaxID=1033854 RepID=UPI003B2DB0AD
MNLIPTRIWRYAALAWLGVVLYLTLLPFTFGDMSFAEAWARYQNIRFDGSGPRARQQWVSNVLMFVPLGFLWAGWWLHRVRSPWLQGGGAVLVAGFCLLVTASVEFLQFWIPNRGPSLTDISANATGGVIGVLAWLVSRVPVVRQAARGLIQRQHGPGAWLLVYLAAYVFVSLLPLDLVITAREWSAKLASGQWGLFVAEQGCWWGVRCVSLHVLEVLLMLPLGLWVAWRMDVSGYWSLVWAGALGVLLGLLVELGLLLTVSGVSEGASVLLHGLGAVLGAMLWAWRERLPWQWLSANLRGLLLAMLPVYLLVASLVVLAGSDGWATLEAAMAQLQSLRWLPLYYHYFIAEGQAIRSVFMNLGVYAFLGLGLWLWDLRRSAGAVAHRGAWAALFAFSLASALETSKLFLVGLRPDTAAPILGAVSAAGVYLILWWMLDGLRWRR